MYHFFNKSPNINKGDNIMEDLFSGIFYMCLYGCLFVLLSLPAMFLLPYFGSRFFYSHLSSREILINTAICGLLILLSIGTCYIFISETTLKEVISLEYMKKLEYWASLTLLIIYLIYTVILGAINKRQKIIPFL